MASPNQMFPALLKYWRHKRGLSQLDLALAADVSARHVSFLETARAQPSREMVLKLAATLHVPLREQNALLQAAGFAPAFAEPALPHQVEGPIRQAIERMLTQHEPYPMVVMNRRYDILQASAAATRVLSRFLAEPSALEPPLNVFHALFDPRLIRPFVVDWERTARGLLSRLHLEALERAHDEALRELLQRLFAYPDVPRSWRHPDFEQPPAPTFSFRMRRGALDLAFLTTVTVFSAPTNVTLDELRLESYFPLDAATEQACRELAEDPPVCAR